MHKLVYSNMRHMVELQAHGLLVVKGGCLRNAGIQQIWFPVGASRSEGHTTGAFA